MPGRIEGITTPWSDDLNAPHQELSMLNVLLRIASALERANDLNAPAAEINAFNLKQLKAATEGGILSTPGQLIRK